VGTVNKLDVAPNVAGTKIAELALLCHLETWLFAVL
jgi:hypothetical protein